MARVVCVSGGIGCGKTTLLEMLQEDLKDKKVLIHQEVTSKLASSISPHASFIDRQNRLIKGLGDWIESSKMDGAYDVIIFDRSTIDYVDACLDHWSLDLIEVGQKANLDHLKDVLHIQAPTPTMALMRERREIWLGTEKRIRFFREMFGINDSEEVDDEVMLTLMHDQMVRSEVRISEKLSSSMSPVIDPVCRRLRYLRVLRRQNPLHYYNWQMQARLAVVNWLGYVEKEDEEKARLRSLRQQMIENTRDSV